MLAEAGLSFLGVGVSPEIPTWGTMIAAGRQYVGQADWMTLFPGIAIVLCVLSLQWSATGCATSSIPAAERISDNDPFPPEHGPLLIAGGRRSRWARIAAPIDILVGEDGRIARFGPSLSPPEGARRIEAKGAYVSPGWVDLHAHVWHGGTDISIRP